MNRNVTIITFVVALHIGALWLLQPGSVRRATERVVPIEILSTRLPDQPSALAPAGVQTIAKPLSKPATKPQSPKTLEIGPLQNATATSSEPSAEALISPTPPVSASATSVATESGTVTVLRQTAAKSEVSPSAAQYLSKPEPPYPILSVRLDEEGRAIVRVLIGVDGMATRATIAQSSGFPRLDQASLVAVTTWRYVPAKRNGVTEPMWFDVPINWTLK